MGYAVIAVRLIGRIVLRHHRGTCLAYWHAKDVG